MSIVWTTPIVTTRLNDGRIVLAKDTPRYGRSAVTYANRTQAERARARLGDEWRVTGHNPYYVTQKEA